MSEEKNLYLPLFYNVLEITTELSDEDFGLLVRTLLRTRANPNQKVNLSKEMKTIYNFLLDSASRVINASNKRAESIKTYYKEKYSDTHADEAFEKALARTYGDGESQ